MGYSFGWTSKKELIDYLTRPWGEEETNTTIAHQCAGNVLWSVVERRTVATGKAERFIACALLSGSSNDWGYKGLSESMGPFYYTCPLKYLDMVPPENEDWRAKVRAYWNGKKEARVKNAALTAGTEITLPEGWTVRRFTLVKRIKNTWQAYGSDGRYYRLPLKAIQQASITPAA